MAYCKECGAGLSEGARFCESCGTEVTRQQSAGGICPSCGYEKQEGDNFCPECGGSFAGAAPPGPPVAKPGAAVQPEIFTPGAPPPSYSPAAQATQQSPRNKRKIGLIIAIAAVSLLVIAGIVTGLALFLNHRANQNAIKEAEQQAVEALEAAEDIDSVEEELLESIRNLSLAGGLDEMKTQMGDLQKRLRDASSRMEASAKGLEKVPVKRLPEWRREYIELLRKAAREEVAALDELNNLVKRMDQMIEFTAVYESGANAYASSLNTLNQAVGQHDAEDYAGAKTTAAQVSALLTQAKQDIDKAAKMEPESGAGDLLGTISNVEAWMNGFNQVCDLGAS
ncbi:MAG: zinc-ribbon domain-containing protein, partial [Actinobacteria bacterium]|nr:zinc-ribbon domain-containing protein [Actinomycetota bacterium]